MIDLKDVEIWTYHAAKACKGLYMRHLEAEVADQMSIPFAPFLPSEL